MPRFGRATIMPAGRKFRNGFLKVKLARMEYLPRAPTFMLYGGQSEWPTLESVHCETIASRSSLHDWHIRPHRHSGLYQILHLHKGCADVHFEDARHHIHGPAVVEIPQAFVHGFEFDEGCAGHVLTLTYPLLQRLVRSLGPRAATPARPLITPLQSDLAVRQLHLAFRELNDHYRLREPFHQARIEAWLTLIYARLRSLQSDLRQAAVPQSRTLEHFSRFNELLEEHYCVHHAVAWYAERLYMTAAHLNVITRTHAERSPLELIHARLMLEATRSLVYSTLTISELADILGFGDPAHFTRFFRRVTGESPRGFRQRANAQARLAAQGDPA